MITKSRMLSKFKNNHLAHKEIENAVYISCINGHEDYKLSKFKLNDFAYKRRCIYILSVMLTKSRNAPEFWTQWICIHAKLLKMQHACVLSWTLTNSRNAPNFQIQWFSLCNYWKCSRQKRSQLAETFPKCKYNDTAYKRMHSKCSLYVLSERL